MKKNTLLAMAAACVAMLVTGCVAPQKQVANPGVVVTTAPASNAPLVEKVFVNKAKTIDEVKNEIATSPSAINCDGIKTKITKVAVLTSKEWKKLTRSTEVPNTKYLVRYGVVKKHQSYDGFGPMVPTAKVSDFKYLVGTPVCLNDPDVDYD
jgi:hypothetical protein